MTGHETQGVVHLGAFAGPGDASAPPARSRRRFLTQATVAGAGLAVAGMGAGAALAAPLPSNVDFSVLRERWRTISLGPAFDPADPAFASALESIDENAQLAVNLLIDDPLRTQVFSDLPFLNGKSADLTKTYSRLRAMAVAYGTPGAALQGEASVLSKILAGLQSAYTLAYNENASAFDAWFDWEIGVPLHLLDTCVFLYDEVPAADRANYLRALDHFNYDPGWNFDAPNSDFPDRVRRESTGSNRVLMCRNVVTRGVLGDDGDKISLALDRLSPMLQYAHLDLSYGGANDGFYPDGSFIHHRTTPSSGSYGSDFLASVSKVLGLLGDSPWSSSVPNVQVIYDAVERTFAPIIYNGHRMESVIGRAVTRRRDSVPAISIINAVLELASGMDAQTATRWRGMCKGWLLRHPTYPGFLANQPAAGLSLMRNVLDDDSLAATPEPNGLRIFPRMGRAIHRGDGWAYAIAMSSERVKHYAHQIVENWRGFHTSSGMTYLYTADKPDVFTGDYWPTANVYGHPGATIDTRPLPDKAGPAIPDNTWSGGAVLDGRVGAIGQDLHGLASAMQAHKSWFCLPDRVVALGAGISDPIDPANGYPVITTMEHRLLDIDGEPALVIDGETQSGDEGWQSVIDGASWAHLDGTAGYVLLDGTPALHASREDRTGRWSDIGDAGPSTDITRRYVSLWFDHGVAPDGASYSYLVLPTATAAETAAAAADPQIEVIANTPVVQAVRMPNAGLYLANFYEAGSTDRLSADGPCSVVAEESASTITVAIADPTHHRDQVQVTVMLGAWDSSQGAPTVQVTAVRPTHEPETDRGGRGTRELHSRAALITVDTSARDGITHTVTLTR